MVDEAKLCSPLCSTFEAFVCDVQSGAVMEKNWARAVDQCWLQGLQFSVYLIDLLSVLVRNHYWFHQDSESCSRSDQQQTTRQ